MSTRVRHQVKPGARFGRWTVLGEGPRNKHGNRTFDCRCDCGAEKTVRRDRLVSGKTRSCGCYRDELLATRPRPNTGRHGHWYGGEASPTWRSWQSMLIRCRQESEPCYPLYGGRGVTVCARWDPAQGGSFENFLADMGERPPGLSIDKEIKGGRGNKLYSPENCCWASSTEQQRNKRNNRLISYNGETLCMTEWAERVGLSPSTLLGRLDSGWAVEKALFTAPMVLSPEQKKEQHRLRIEQIMHLRAQGMAFPQIGAQLGLSRQRVSQLLRAANTD